MPWCRHARKPKKDRVKRRMCHPTAGSDGGATRRRSDTDDSARRRYPMATIITANAPSMPMRINGSDEETMFTTTTIGGIAKSTARPREKVPDRRQITLKTGNATKLPITITGRKTGKYASSSLPVSSRKKPSATPLITTYPTAPTAAHIPPRRAGHRKSSATAGYIPINPTSAAAQPPPMND